MKLEEIQSLVKTINQSNIEKFRFKNNDIEMEIVKTGRKIDTNSQINKEVIEDHNQLNQENDIEKIEANTINSPLVGVFYEASSPNEDAFVKEGQQVKKGQVLCIIEAMKVMNEIVAKEDCKIKKILVSNEDIVEYDQELFIIE
ncbi:MAG TPA: acetyl-CoA carboxylase biotin carboxyl carrier protein [Clostridia bacterium]|nr:acetyl-CoA carboxylase biotin carboxyl carrier protein [Clostridia bacterium]